MARSLNKAQLIGNVGNDPEIRMTPGGAKIVAFHGDPRPIDVARAGRDRWARFPRYGRGPVDWVRDYWLENGYSDPL